MILCLPHCDLNLWRAVILSIQILALYKSFTYLLTYLQLGTAWKWFCLMVSASIQQTIYVSSSTIRCY